MQIEYLYYFLDVAKTLSISQSAKSLYITPQGLSRAIKSLEEEFNVELFIRTKYGLVPTEEGIEFIAYANEFLKSFESFLSKSRGIKPCQHKDMGKTFTIYTTPLFTISGVIADILNSLSEAAPHSNFLVKEQLPLCALKSLIQDQCHSVGLINIPHFSLKDFTLPAEFEYDYLLEISMVAYVSPKSIYRNKKFFDKRELVALPLSCFNESLAEDCVRYMLEDYGEPNIVFSSSDAGLYRKIAGNQNIVNISVNLVQNFNQLDRVAIPIRDTLKLSVILFYRSKQKGEPSMKAVIPLIKSYLLNNYPHLAVTKNLIPDNA